MIEFQLLDVDYILVNEKPVIRLFGKTDSNETICCFYEGYLPYFYTDFNENVKKILANESEVLKIEEVKKNDIESNSEKKFYKITIKNPGKIPELREKINQYGIKTHEADILFKYRAMCDLGLRGSRWIKINEMVHTQTNSVIAKRKIQAKKLEEIKRYDDVELKTMAFDLECLSKGLPDGRKDPIIMISFAFSEPYKGNKALVLSTRPGKDVKAFNTEKEMLEEFIRVVNEYDPDVLTGYNINNFDIPFILERMKQKGVKPIFGRCQQKPVISKKFGYKYKTNIIGRIIVDSYEIIKKDFSLQRYSLNFVSEALLKEKKEPVKHSEIEKLWKGNQEDYEKLVKYSKKDSILALDLFLKLRLVSKYLALSKISGTLLQDTLDGGETVRIENYLLKEFNSNNYIFPSKPDKKTVSDRYERDLGGGEVFSPVKGLHSNVIVLDFKAMYPSIIKTFNICPTTLTKEYKEGYIKSPSGAVFLPKEIKQGIIPRILEKLMEKRQEIKKNLKKSRDKNEQKRLYDVQWAFKILANAFYGYFGYSRSRLFSLDIANSITSFGRSIIINTKENIEKEFGCKVIYGDTDSVFVQSKSENLDEIAEFGKKVAKKITLYLPGSIELEFEKIFKRFLSLTKKRYAALTYTLTKNGWEENIETKGIETVRRDWCELVGITLEKILEIILKKNDVKSAVEYFKTVIKQLIKNKIPIEQLIITKTMTKTPRNYAGIQPHVELVKKIQSRNPAEVPDVGDRIGYVIIKGTGLVSKRAEDPTYVKEKGLELDSRYYIENQLLPPTERIFRSLGISKSELFGNGKQIGILEALNNHNGHNNHHEEITKVNFTSSLNGFICQTCHKSYESIPLLGVCSCGGKIKFSSKNGPVDALKLP